MTKVFTFLLPGLGQLFSGDARKAGLIFVSALIAGALTGGLGYLACGVWSVLDMHTRTPSAGQSTVGTLLGTTDVPAPSSSSGTLQTVMPWVFKFSILGLCALLVLGNVRGGGVLQSLELFGVRLQFASLASEANRAADGEETVDAGAREAAIEAVASAMQATPDGAAPILGEQVGSDGDAVNSADPPAAINLPSVGAEAGAFAGNYSSDLGATYQIRANGPYVEITETSRLLFVPFTSMTCQGQTNGQLVEARCVTMDGQTGNLVLAPDGMGGLGGIFTATSTGMRIPLNLSR